VYLIIAPISIKRSGLFFFERNLCQSERCSSKEVLLGLIHRGDILCIFRFSLILPAIVHLSSIVLQIWIKTHTLINKCMRFYPFHVHLKRKDSESTKRF